MLPNQIPTKLTRPHGLSQTKILHFHFPANIFKARAKRGGDSNGTFRSGKQSLLRVAMGFRQLAIGLGFAGGCLLARVVEERRMGGVARWGRGYETGFVHQRKQNIR